MAQAHIEDRQDATLTRRRLLALGVAAGASLGFVGFVAAPPALGRDRWLRRASYVGRIGEPFRVRAAGGPTVTLRLEAVSDLSGTSPRGASLAGRDDAFLLEFRGPDAPQLTQGIHELRHDTLGRASLFLVPHTRDELGCTYAVVVSRAHR